MTNMTKPRCPNKHCENVECVRRWNQESQTGFWGCPHYEDLGCHYSCLPTSGDEWGLNLYAQPVKGGERLVRNCASHTKGICAKPLLDLVGASGDPRLCYELLRDGEGGKDLLVRVEWAGGRAKSLGFLEQAFPSISEC